MFKKKQFGVGGAIVFFLLVASVGFAEGKNETRFGIGLQATVPTIGISGMIDVTENVSVQGTLGVFGGLKIYGGRGIFRRYEDPYRNAYGYVAISAICYSESSDFGKLIKAATAIGVGIGAGKECNWQTWSTKLPPIWWNYEVGLGYWSKNEHTDGFLYPIAGVGAQYRF